VVHVARPPIILVTLLALSAALGARAGGRATATADVDRATFHQGVLPRGVPLACRTFDASGADLGTGKSEEKKKKHEAAETLQEAAPPLFDTALRTALEESGVFASVVQLGPDDAVPDGAALVEGRFTLINPGSKGKRYWVGMGAGKSKICFDGRVLAPDGTAVADFEHCRVGTIGWFGGDAAGMMATDVRKGATNLGDFVVHLAQGEYQRK
jgi:hypothetical protein